MSRLAVPAAATQAVDWSRFGVVVPVLAGSPGAGASVLAAAVTDALQQAGRRVLLVDAADPARSGLAAAAPEEGLHVRQVHPGLHLRYSWRHESLLARMESRFPITPAMVPPPPAWLPDRGPVHVTVVDVGHDGWRAAADPLLGAGGWLRRGQPATLPILVVRPTRPSLQQAEQVLARLYRWVNARVAEPPAQLVVVGARRWPRGVTGAAGRLLDPLIPDAVFVPLHRRVELGGVTGDLLPRPTDRRPDCPAAGPAAHHPPAEGTTTLMFHQTVLDHLTVLAAGAIPKVNTQAPPGSEKILSIVGFVKWIAGAGIIACFLGGIVAFTAGRMFDHHRTGRMGLIFMMAAGVGAMLFAVGPQLLNTLAGP